MLKKSSFLLACLVASTVAFAHAHGDHGHDHHHHHHGASHDDHHHHHHATSSATVNYSAKAVAKLPEAKGIHSQGCWVRLLPVQVHSSAYFVLQNHSQHTITLKGVYSPDFKKSELHTTTEENGQFKMMPLLNQTVPAGESITFKPKSYHVMLMKNKGTLKAGQTATLTLILGKTKHTMQCEVKDANAL